MLTFAFLVFVVVASGIAGLRGVLGTTTTWYALVVLQLLFLLVVLVDQASGLLVTAGRGLRGLIRGRPTAGQMAAETLPYEEWTMRLCHHDGERGADELLAAVSERLTRLAGHGAVLVCPRDGITTSQMRARAAVWADGLKTGENQEVSVRLPRHPPVRWQRIADTGSFFFLWLAGVAAAMLCASTAVAGFERGACAGTCAGRPATFPAALDWLLHRLMWQEPPNLSAITFQARATGLMIQLLGLLTLVIAGFALVRHIRYRQQLRAEHQQRMTEVYGRERVLLIVATSVERDAVLAQARAHRDVAPVLDFGDGHPVYRLGDIGGVDVVLAQVGTGVTSPVSAAYSVPELLDAWRPRYVIMPGICYGLREERQRLGDVIVAEQLQVISVRAGETEIRDRGDKVTAGHRLVERFTVAVPPPGVRVWPGLMLSWDVLVDSPALREALRTRYADAEGGEMEGAGVYATSVRAGTEWIVVKGICDWGRDKNPDAQELAAGNSAKLVFDLLAARAFATRTPNGRSG